MKLTDYLRAQAADFLFVSLAALALAYTLLDGFYVNPALQHGPWCAIVVGVCEAALFLVAFSRRTAVWGGILYGIALVIGWEVAAALTPEGMVFVDSEQNYLIFAMVSTLTATGCFLLARKQVGAVLLFVIGSVLCGLMQFFYHGSYALWTLLFVGASLALLVYKNYQRSVTSVSSARAISFFPGFAVALGATAVAVGVGCGLWFGVIEPLHPEAAEVKLITEYRAYETRAVRGTSNEFQLPDTSMTSSEVNEGVRTTDDIKEDPQGAQWPANRQPDSEEMPQQNQGSFLGIDFDSLTEEFDLENNPSAAAVLWVVIGLLVLVVAAYFVGRRVYRGIRLNRFRRQGAEREVESVFLFLMERYGRLGIRVPPGQSLAEFGLSSGAAMAPFDRAAQVRFADLASDYAATVYGAQPVTGEGVSRAEALYRSFWKGARRKVGSLRYFAASFRL